MRARERAAGRTPQPAWIKPQPGQPTRAPSQDREARRRNLPRPSGSARRSSRTRRWRRKRPAKLRGRRYVAHGTGTRTTAAMGPGATDGNQGESTGTDGGPRQRQHTESKGSRQTPDRQQRQRVSADFSCVCFFGRGLHKPVAFVARAGLPPCVLANLGRKRGQGSGTTTPDHGNTGARGWDLSTVTRSGSGHSGVRKRQPHSRRFRRPPQHRQRS